MSLVPGQASIIHQIFAKFVTRVPHAQHRLHAPNTDKSIERRMAAALETLGEGIGDPTIAKRNPLSSLSFSCLKSQVVKDQMESLDSYRKGITSAYQPVGEDGRAFRKYFRFSAFPVSRLTLYLGTQNEVLTIGTWELRTVFQQQVCYCHRCFRGRPLNLLCQARLLSRMESKSIYPRKLRFHIRIQPHIMAGCAVPR